MSYLDTLKARAEMVKEWRKYIHTLVKAIKKVLPSAEVYIFGSAITGKATALSDIDILIIASNLPKTNIERAQIKALIEDEAKLPYHHPFQIHLTTKEEARPYLRRAGKNIIKLKQP